MRTAIIVASLTLAFAAACGSDDAGSGGGAPGGGGDGGDTVASGGDGADGGGGGAAGGGAAGGSGGTGGMDCAPPNVGGNAPAPVVDFAANVTVSTLAGSATAGTLDGTGAAAQFDNPVNLVLDSNLDMAVAGFENGVIRRVTSAGVVTTPFSGMMGYSRPVGLAFDAAGMLFTQTDMNTSGNNGENDGSIWSVDLTLGTATLVAENIGRPRGLVFSGMALAMSDLKHHAIRKMNVTTKVITDFVGQWDCPGNVDGTGDEARFYQPWGIARAPNGDLIVADRSNHSIRRVTPAGVVTTIAGTGRAGMVDGALAAAHFNAPGAVAVDAAGIIYVSDVDNHRIRRIDQPGDVVDSLAGTGVEGFADGAGNAAQFYGQEGIAVLPDGSALYVADGDWGQGGLPYHRIRVITLP